MWNLNWICQDLDLCLMPCLVELSGRPSQDLYRSLALGSNNQIPASDHLDRIGLYLIDRLVAFFCRSGVGIVAQFYQRSNPGLAHPPQKHNCMRLYMSTGDGIWSTLIIWIHTP